MWTLLFSFLAGPAVQIGLKIADLVMARQQAKTDIEIKQIDEAINQLNKQSDVIVASQKNPITGTIYWILLTVAAIGPITYINKYFIWDKVMGGFTGCAANNSAFCKATFSTDPIDATAAWIIVAVFTFLFLTSRKK